MGKEEKCGEKVGIREIIRKYTRYREGARIAEVVEGFLEEIKGVDEEEMEKRGLLFFLLPIYSVKNTLSRRMLRKMLLNREIVGERGRKRRVNQGKKPKRTETVRDAASGRPRVVEKASGMKKSSAYKDLCVLLAGSKDTCNKKKTKGSKRNRTEKEEKINGPNSAPIQYRYELKSLPTLQEIPHIKKRYMETAPQKLRMKVFEEGVRYGRGL